MYQVGANIVNLEVMVILRLYPKEKETNVGYSDNIRAHSELKKKLHSMTDDEICAIWKNVGDEGFHPDAEFAQFGLEDKMTDDEFVGMLCEEVDERACQKSPSGH